MKSVRLKGEGLNLTYGTKQPPAKAGGFLLRAESHGYASAKRCVSLAQYQNHHLCLGQNDELNNL